MMKNKLIVLFAVIAFCLVMALPAGASNVIGFVPVERTLPLVVDNADVLTEDEETALEARLTLLGNENNLEIGVVTVDSYEGKDPQAYADDFYDYNGYGCGENDDGLIVVFNTGIGDGNRNLTVSTHGKAIDLVNNTEIDNILDAMIPRLIAGEYAEGFDAFVYECEWAIFSYTDSYDSDDSFEEGFITDDFQMNIGDKSVPLYFIPLSIVIGFAVAFIIVKIQASGLKNVRKKVDASGYVEQADITASRDRFLYKNVKRIPKPKNTSTGRGGSVHRSSSGRSHGGGGRSF